VNARPLLVAVGALLALVLPAGAAAADAEDLVARYAMAIELDADGTAHVVLDLDMDFGTEPNRGPFLTYVVKQRFDDTQDRVFRYTNIEASSSTGAVDTVDVEESDGWLEIRIGEEDRDEFTGVQSYRITYDVDGWVNTAAFFGPTTGLSDDELYLNVIGARWEVPLERISVTVTAPVPATAADCFAGYGSSTARCTAAQAGDTAVFRQGRLDIGEQLTVVAAYPAGTFEAEPILQERWAVGRAFSLNPGTGAVAALVALGGGAFAVTRARRRGRDDQYLGLTPGLSPAPGQQAAVGARRRSPVAVQFTPPVGFQAGQLGTLVDEKADPHDVTATIVDLAVRGYLLIQQVPPGDEFDEVGWRLIRTARPADGLLAYEQTLLSSMFDGREQVELEELRTTFAASMIEVQSQLYEDVTARGWFRGNPSSVRNAAVGWGILVMVGGIGLTVLLAARTSWGLVGLPVVAVGILMIAMSGSAPARTADGSAVLAQAEGFRLYLATAEADQLRFEEGQDLFSRYLPYAVAFGLTERWARVFADLAARGADLPTPAWYLAGPGYGPFWASGALFAQDLSTFTHLADTAISAPTPGSGGSSGFSGGFSGGGVGGGGGGSW